MSDTKCCLNCAFLYDPDEAGKPVQSADEKLRADLNSGQNVKARKLQCYKGVWGPETVDGVPGPEIAKVLKDDRSRDCFFLAHRAMVTCAAAASLEAREEKRRTDRAIKCAAWITCFATIVAAIVGGIIGGYIATWGRGH